MRITGILIFVLFISCSGQQQRNDTSEIITDEQTEQETDNQSEIPQIGEIGQPSILTGHWLTTILPDSIKKAREVLRWKDRFYGGLFLTIKENDTLILSGNMDWYPFAYTKIDDYTLLLLESNNSQIYYEPKKDLIFWGRPSMGQLFRRIDQDFVDTIRDENLLMAYIINILFNVDFLPKDFYKNIKYISLGLETYTPFTFDAIGIENESGDLDYYGWKFSGDILNLYKTSYTYDDDSGFISYQIESLDRQFFNNN